MPYRVEYASTNRAACKGPQPCAGTKMEKGEIRFGTVVEIMGNTSFQWRHFGCISAKQVKNMTSELGAASELDGYEDLNEEDQAKFDRLWADGEVPEEEAMARGHDPLNYLSMPDLKARAKQDDVDFKGLGKADLVKAVRAAIGGAAPVKIRKEPMDEWTATELKEKCEEVGLPTSGAKPALIGRLREHFGPLPDSDDDEAAEGDGGEDRKPDVGRAKRKSDDLADSDDDNNVKPKGKGKAAASARAKPAPKPKGGRKAKKEETSDEESATSSDDSPSASSSSDEEASAESSASDDESSAEESDVKPKKGAPAKGRNGKRPARKAEAAPAKRPQRGTAGRKAKVESDDEDEDVKPKVKRDKAPARGKKAAKPEPSSDEDAAPVRKKKRVVKSEPEDSE